jgi:hypothetical protein
MTAQPLYVTSVLGQAAPTVAIGALDANGVLQVASATNPLPIGATLTLNPSVTITSGTVGLTVGTSNIGVVTPYSVASANWQYAAPTGGIITTAPVTLVAAAGTGVRNYITALQIKGCNAVASEVVIRDGAAVVLWRGYVAATMLTADDLVFPTPLMSSTGVNSAITLTVNTTATLTYVTAQGFTA